MIQPYHYKLIHQIKVYIKPRFIFLCLTWNGSEEDDGDY